MNMFEQFEKYCNDYPQNFDPALTVREIARRAFFFRPNVFQPCGHPLSAIVTNGTTSYCGQCADDSLRANINEGIEA